MPVIRGRHNRQQIFLDVVIIDARQSNISPHADQKLSVNLEPVRALIDTGATATSITPAAASKLALRMAGEQLVKTANGNKNVPFYFFKVGFHYPGSVEPTSSAMPFHVLPDPVVGLELIFDSSPFDILLGMDVLSQGDLKIFKNGEFSFEF